MNEEEILRRLTGVFREIFEDPALVASPRLSPAEVDKWDSLTHIDMIMAVEAEFCIRIPTLELIGMQNVGDLVRQIGARAR